MNDLKRVEPLSKTEIINRLRRMVDLIDVLLEDDARYALGYSYVGTSTFECFTLQVEELTSNASSTTLHVKPRIQPGNIVVGSLNNWAGKTSYIYLYEFGHYDENDDAVVYKRGRRNLQDAMIFPADCIRLAKPDDLTEYSWGI